MSGDATHGLATVATLRTPMDEPKPPPDAAPPGGPPPGGPPPGSSTPGPVLLPAGYIEQNKDARTMAMLAHLLGAIMGFIGPLIIWLIKKDEHAFVNDQGKEALNFQLTLLIAYLVCVAINVVSCGFLFFVIFIPMLMQLILGIIGCVQANNGIVYRYPMCIRMIS
jgi:uncharacterized Tic20 family protein